MTGHIAAAACAVGLGALAGCGAGPPAAAEPPVAAAEPAVTPVPTPTRTAGPLSTQQLPPAEALGTALEAVRPPRGRGERGRGQRLQRAAPGRR